MRRRSHRFVVGTSVALSLISLVIGWIVHFQLHSVERLDFDKMAGQVYSLIFSEVSEALRPTLSEYYSNSEDLPKSFSELLEIYLPADLDEQHAIQEHRSREPARP